MGNLLSVPYIKQRNRTATCGAVCAAMLIKFYTKNKTSVDEIWEEVSDKSPELGRQYCRTYKIGQYLTANHFNCVTVQYSSLKELLEFCNSNGIAPIVNHKSFENPIGGHFSIVKNLVGERAIINDPENKARVSVSLKELDFLAQKKVATDEVGGNTAIVPILNKFEKAESYCFHCESIIDTSFTQAINFSSGKKVVVADLCQACDVFNPVK